MNSQQLSKILHGLPLGSIKYFNSIGSTNDEAAHWAIDDAPDLSLVVADEQTAGRGRFTRRWYSPAGASLAFSLILCPNTFSDLRECLPRLNALGALAVCETLVDLYSVNAQIKWPNDVLISRKKCAGVLAESHWQGDQLQAVVLGIGVNVKAAAVPPESEQLYPATSIEIELGKRIDRWRLLKEILTKLLYWRYHLLTGDFWPTWESSLAYRDEWVSLHEGDQETEVFFKGINPDGSLRVVTRTGEIQRITSSDVTMRSLS